MALTTECRLKSKLLIERITQIMNDNLEDEKWSDLPSFKSITAHFASDAVNGFLTAIDFDMTDVIDILVDDGFKMEDVYKAVTPLKHARVKFDSCRKAMPCRLSFAIVDALLTNLYEHDKFVCGTLRNDERVHRIAADVVAAKCLAAPTRELGKRARVPKMEHQVHEEQECKVRRVQVMKSSPLQTRLVDEVNTAVLRVLSEMGLIAT
jgi:hypothetical protein